MCAFLFVHNCRNIYYLTSILVFDDFFDLIVVARFFTGNLEDLWIGNLSLFGNFRADLLNYFVKLFRLTFWLFSNGVNRNLNRLFWFWWCFLGEFDLFTSQNKSLFCIFIRNHDDFLFLLLAVFNILFLYIDNILSSIIKIDFCDFIDCHLFLFIFFDEIYCLFSILIFLNK